MNHDSSQRNSAELDIFSDVCPGAPAPPSSPQGHPCCPELGVLCRRALSVSLYAPGGLRMTLTRAGRSVKNPEKGRVGPFVSARDTPPGRLCQSARSQHSRPMAPCIAHRGEHEPLKGSRRRPRRSALPAWDWAGPHGQQCRHAMVDVAGPRTDNAASADLPRSGRIAALRCGGGVLALLPDPPLLQCVQAALGAGSREVRSCRSPCTCAERRDRGCRAPCRGRLGRRRPYRQPPWQPHPQRLRELWPRHGRGA